ncbi:hypothetical protein IANJMKHF_00070 [Klebsiella phage CPRSA]|nr:hypothetical protein IANJMKHF_00070 [Klebsiella phage CPRSA]UQJ95463.1 hypothetical protein ALHIDCOG_00075 [Klebsiella phage CPRSB]
MNDKVLAYLVFLLGYRLEVMGAYSSIYGDLTAIWMVGLGLLLHSFPLQLLMNRKRILYETISCDLLWCFRH